MNQTEKRKVEAIEQQILGEKPWQLKGEVSAYTRPQNSLLFEDVDFEKRLKAPQITAEVTQTIESVIRERIKDNKFDDPVRKTKPVHAVASARPQVEVSAEKSKVGLAQLYEQELLAKTSTAQPKDGPEKEVEQKLYALFRKLDALVDR